MESRAIRSTEHLSAAGHSEGGDQFMHNSSLPEFVSKVIAHNRIGYGDLRRLQRDILPNGITTREEAEALIGLDQAVTRIDNGWPGFLAAAVTEFVMSGSTPQGCIDRETAEWLASILSGMEARTALGIAREIVQESNQVDEVLLAFARKSPKAKSQPADRSGRTMEAVS
jgi:hypothetical protein